MQGDLKAPTEILSYEALYRIAHEIAQQIKNSDPNGNQFWISTTALVDLILGYQMFLKQVEVLQEQYSQLLKPPTAAEIGPAAVLPLLPTAATGILSAVADILAFFRTETTISGVSITLPETAMVAALVRGFSQVYAQAQEKPKVHYGALFIPGMVTAQGSSVLSWVRQVQNNVGEAQAIIEAFRIKDKETQDKDPYKARIPQLEALNTETTKMLDNLTKSENGTSPLQQLIKAELTLNKLNDPNARFLYASVVQAGGINKMTRNLFTGSRLSHSASATVTYIVFDWNGTIRVAGTVGELHGFVEMKTHANSKLLQTGYEREEPTR